MNHSGDDAGWVGCFEVGSTKDETVDTGVGEAYVEDTRNEDAAGAEKTSAELVANRIAAVVQVENAAVRVEIATVGIENAAGAEAAVIRAAVGRAGLVAVETVIDVVAEGAVVEKARFFVVVLQFFAVGGYLFAGGGYLFAVGGYLFVGGVR